jgi:hypothetical protein
VGRRLHVNRRTVWDWVNQDPELRDLVDDLTEAFIDEAENKLYEAIRSGNVVATIFFLKTKARHRGYSERLELIPMTQQLIEVELAPIESIESENDHSQALNGNSAAIALLEQ